MFRAPFCKASPGECTPQRAERSLATVIFVCKVKVVSRWQIMVYMMTQFVTRVPTYIVAANLDRDRPERRGPGRRLHGENSSRLP